MEISIARTFNLGNYESLKINISETKPWDKTPEEFFETLSDLVENLYKARQAGFPKGV